MRAERTLSAVSAGNAPDLHQRPSRLPDRAFLPARLAPGLDAERLALRRAAAVPAGRAAMPDADADPDPDADADPDADLPAGSALPDADANPDADPHADADANPDANSNAHADAHAIPDADYSVAAVMRPRRLLPAAGDQSAGDPTLPALSALSVLPRTAAGLALRSPRISGLPDLSSLLPLAASSGHDSVRRLRLRTHAVLES